MEITKKNFELEMKNFMSVLPKAKFISIDLEFTGLPKEQINVTDTPMEVYYKSMTCANYNNIIQMGISVFTNSTENSKNYHVSSYTFYIFPCTYNGKVNQKISLDVSAVEFNVASGGVDFGLWITQGVPYFNKKLQSQLRRCFENDRKVELNSTFKESNEKDANVEKKEKPVEEYVNSVTIFDPADRQAMEESIAKFKAWIAKFDFGSQFVFENTKSILRQYFWNEIRNVYGNQLGAIIVEESNGETNSLKFTMTTEAEKEEYKKKALVEMELNYQKQLGFSFYWEEIKAIIKKNNTPAVFHQGNLDLMYIMSHFENWIPMNFQEYQKTVNNCFPIIYDTKNLVRFTKFTTTYLEGLFEDVIKTNKIDTKTKYKIVNLDNKLENQVAHNAGFDSYITGVVFAEFSEVIGDLSSMKNQVSLFKNKFFNLAFKDSNDFYLEKNTFIFSSNEKDDVEKTLTKGAEGKRERGRSNKKGDESRDKLKTGLNLFNEEKAGQKAFSMCRHSQLEVIGRNVFYFVTFEKELEKNDLSFLQEKFKEDFNIQNLKEYYSKVFVDFESHIYQSKN